MNNEVAASEPEEERDIRESLTATAHEIEQRVQTTRDQAYELNRQAVEFIQERPVAALAIAFGVGYLVGKLASKRWLV